MKCRIINADVLKGLAQLETESIQTCVTSPPYWSLRDYQHEAQIGLEATPDKYVEAIVEVFREVRRVLRLDGTLWINMGDAYAGSGKASGRTWEGDAIPQMSGKQASNAGSLIPGVAVPSGMKAKDLVGLPWMVAFALRQDGWYLRSDIIWSKPNPMPESVTDRPTKSHEYIFLLTKSPTYFYDAQAIAEPMKYTGLKNQTLGGFESAELYNGKHSKLKSGYAPPGQAAHSTSRNGSSTGTKHEGVLKQDALDKRTYTGFNERWDEAPTVTRNKRTVWTIPTQPYSEAHFATFPEDLIKPCILAGTSERGCCSECGVPWERETGRDTQPHAYQDCKYDRSDPLYATKRNMGARYQAQLDANPMQTIGWSPTCKHNASVVPCTVLDPFSGSGTVGLVSMQYGRDYVGIELNAEYVRMQERRLHSVVSQEILTFD